MPQKLLPQVTVHQPVPGDAGARPLVVISTISAGDVESIEGWVRTLIHTSVESDLRLRLFVMPDVAQATRALIGRLPIAVNASTIAMFPAADFSTALAQAANDITGADFAFVAIGASIPFAWDARLRKAAYATAQIGGATSLCDIHPMFALVDEDLRAVGTDPVLVDRSAYSMGDRSYYDVPRAHAICTYLRRDALDLVQPELPAGDAQATLDHITHRLRARGRNIVLCDFLYVRQPASPSGVPAFSPAPDPIEEEAFLRNHPMAGLRRSVNAALRAGISNVSMPALDAKPVQLHIMHFWGGGLDKWVRDFGRADSERTNLVFSSYRIGEKGGQRLVLYSDPVDPNPIRVWDIAQPIRSTLPSSLEYRRILQQLIREFSVESIIISSLIGHTLDALDQPVKTITVCHDFYPICQAINPQFETTCVRCTLDDLRLCAKENPLNRIFVDQSSEDWQEMRNMYVQRLISNRVDLVVPSPSVAVTLKRLAPRLQEHPMHLIPHGIDLPKRPLPIATLQPGERLRIVVLGRLSLHKGTALLKQAAESLKPFADITLVGGGGNGVKLAADCGWTCIEKYQADELPAILAKISPHAALLASVIPETFSYTLSELNQLCVPSLATALGSFNDRIVDGSNGFLFAPTASALVDLVKKLFEHPELLANVATALQALPSERNCVQMADDYAKLIPAIPRAVARFEIGIGMQSGLTEPYRHLNDAYLQVTAANTHLTNAYEAARKLADEGTVRADSLMPYKAISDQWAASFDALNVQRKWWRLPHAMRLMQELRSQLRNVEQAYPVDTARADPKSPRTKAQD